MLKWLFGRKEAAPQKETVAPQAAQPTMPASAPEAAPVQQTAPVEAAPVAVEPVEVAPVEPAPVPIPEPVTEPVPAPERPAPVAPAAPASSVAPAEPVVTNQTDASLNLSTTETPKAALLKHSLSLLAEGADVEPTVGLDAIAVAPPLVESAKVVKVQAGGRRVLASFGNSAKVRAYSKRADGTYRLEGAPMQSSSRLIVGTTA